MIKFLLKLVGTAVIVLWWIVAGFFKKYWISSGYLQELKKIFADKNENRKGGDSL